MYLTKENVTIVDFTEIDKENYTLQKRPSVYRILVTIGDVELTSTIEYRLEDVITARDQLVS